MFFDIKKRNKRLFREKVVSLHLISIRFFMANYNTSDISRQVHFAVMAIEASAQKACISGKEMHDRLLAQDLIHQRLFRHYEQLHTQSLEWVVDDTLETLYNWEKEAAV